MNVYTVIPSFNPGPIVREVAARVARVLDRDAIIIIDDGSTDGSAERLVEDGFRVVRHPENLGKGMALRTGFGAALDLGADWVITLDADGQHAPEDIPRFIEEAGRQRYQLIVGSRMDDTATMPRLRVIANRATSWVVSCLAGQRVPDSQSGYRMIAASVLAAVPLEMRRYDAESEILVRAARSGFAIGAVPIRTIYGEEVSAIHPVVDTLRFVRLTWRLARLRWGHRPERQRRTA